MEAKVLGLGRQGDGKFAPCAELGLDSLVALVVYVTAGAPIGDVILGDFGDVAGPAMTVFIELEDDAAVIGAVVDHAVDDVAEVLGKSGDFSVPVHSRVFDRLLHRGWVKSCPTLVRSLRLDRTVETLV